MSEIVNYIRNNASKITPAIVERVLKNLPMWKLEFSQINDPKYPHLSYQLSFLADAVEDFAEGVEKNLPYVAIAEAVFALIYAHKYVDIIPDFIPNIGRADDSSIVRAVLIQHEKAFARYAERNGFNWSVITKEP